MFRSNCILHMKTCQERKERMFEKGEYIVYGSSGVCEIMDITTMKMSDVPEDKLYYILRPCQMRDSEIFTPVDNKKIKMRRVLDAKEIKTLLHQFLEMEELEIPREKLRETIYKECIRSCDFVQNMRLVKLLFKRKKSRLSQGKNVPALDERYLKIAENILFSEISHGLGIPQKEMEAVFIRNIRETVKS